MNEQIQKLYDQADKFASQNRVQNIDAPGNNYFELFHEKFAELIVRECAALAKSKSEHIQSMLTDDRGDQAQIHSLAWQFEEFGYKIKKHFGVEERKGWVCPKCGVDRTREACPKGHTAAITGDCPMTATAQSGVEE